MGDIHASKLYQAYLLQELGPQKHPPTSIVEFVQSTLVLAD